MGVLPGLSYAASWGKEGLEATKRRPRRGSKPRLTFGADVGAGDAHFDAVLLHFHLVAGTRSDAGAVVHHEII